MNQTITSREYWKRSRTAAIVQATLYACNAVFCGSLAYAAKLDLDGTRASILGLIGLFSLLMIAGRITRAKYCNRRYRNAVTFNMIQSQIRNHKNQ